MRGGRHKYEPQRGQHRGFIVSIAARWPLVMGRATVRLILAGTLMLTVMVAPSTAKCLYTNPDAPLTKLPDDVAVVAPPTTVAPATLPPSVAQPVCRPSENGQPQSAPAGCNSGSSSPESGSGAVCLAHFRSEHETHAKARFSTLVGPPAVRGTTWSI